MIINPTFKPINSIYFKTFKNSLDIKILKTYNDISES